MSGKGSANLFRMILQPPDVPPMDRFRIYPSFIKFLTHLRHMGDPALHAQIGHKWMGVEEHERNKYHLLTLL